MTGNVLLSALKNHTAQWCLYVFHVTQVRVFSFRADNALTTRAASAARSWKSVYHGVRY